METIFEAVQRVRRRIQEHRAFYQSNEMATRTQIIEPILRSLGWDTEDPNKVLPHLTTDEGIPDYTLLLDGKKVLIVEAKNMSTNMENKQALKQLAKYCFAEGVKFGLLTNGVIWILFRAFEEGTTIAERIIWKVDIVADDIKTVAKNLKTISSAKIKDIDALLEKSKILDEIWALLTKNEDWLVNLFSPAVLSIISEKYPVHDFDIDEVRSLVRYRIKDIFFHENKGEEKRGDRPHQVGQKGLIIIGKDRYPINYSYEILVKTAEWLISKGKLRKTDCPIPTGPKRYLVNTERIHKDGSKFRAPKRLSNGLFIETHCNTEDAIAYAKRLVRHFGFREDVFKFIPSEQ